MSPRSQLKIMPEGKIIEVRNGLGFQALERKTNSIEFDCRKADCGVCLIKVTKGIENLSEADARERDYLKAMGAQQSERLACQARIFGDVEIEVLPAIPPQI